MIKIKLFFLIVCLFFSCENYTKDKIEISDGVYLINDWIYDLKKSDNSDFKISFYTIGKISSTKFNAISVKNSKENVMHGIGLYFKYDKEGENKDQIIGAFFKNTSMDSTEFKFPNCLNICPLKVLVYENDKYIELKGSYSTSNSFVMELKDKVLIDLLEAKKKIRVRIPISINNKNTVFEFFEFDLSDYNRQIEL